MSGCNAVDARSLTNTSREEDEELTQNRVELSKVIGSRVREERRRLELTQEELAERVGLSTNYIAHLERGSRGASLETLEKVAGLLEVPVASLFVAGAQKQAGRPLPDDIRRLSARLRGLDGRTRQLVFNIAEAISHWKRGKKKKK